MRKPVRCIGNFAPNIPAEPGAMTREDAVLFLKLMVFLAAVGAAGIAFVIGRL